MASPIWLRGIIVALVLNACMVDGRSRKFLGEVSKILRASAINISLDDLHEAVLKDQRANYIEPIKSLHTRQVTSLNGLFDFCFDPDSKFVPDVSWAQQPLETSCRPGNFYRMPVPAAFNEILSNETAKNYMGWMWYQTVAVLSADRGSPTSNWFVQFANINYVGLIWAQLIDEHGQAKSDSLLVGSHVGGHLPIVVNVSQLVHSAEPRKGANLRLSIAVSNLLNENTTPSGRLIDMSQLVGHKLLKFEPDFDFFHFAGIMGDVQLIHLPRRYITQAYLLNTYQRTVFEFTYCVAHFNLADYIEFHSLIANEDENVISSSMTIEADCMTSQFTCPNNSSSRLCQAIKRLAVWPSGKVDSIRLRTFEEEDVVGGTRKLVEGDIFDMKLMKRPTLRELIKQRGGQLQGFGMHHEQLFSGRSMSLAAIMKDLQLVKQMGANVLRTSHYPYSSAYLEACDELGIMVIAECSAVGLKSFSPLKLELHKESLREMMLRDHEHPSIVMWSVANEPESQKPEARAYFRQLIDYLRLHLDQFITGERRQLTAAIAQSHESDRVGDLLDIIMVNRYYGWYDYTGQLAAIRPALKASLLGWAERYRKPVLLSEFGADTVAGLHSGELFSEQFQRDLIEEHERLFDELAAASNKTQINFLGGLIWNFADFSTHQSLGRVGGNRKGVFTVDRQAKMAAESVRRSFRRRAGLDEPARQSRTEL